MSDVPVTKLVATGKRDKNIQFESFEGKAEFALETDDRAEKISLTMNANAANAILFLMVKGLEELRNIHTYGDFQPAYQHALALNMEAIEILWTTMKEALGEWNRVTK